MERTVSVIIPTFNRAHFITKTLDSVLEQTYKKLEIIVVDDGSTDDTRRVLDQFANVGRIIYIYQENQGLPAARNTGIRGSSGEYIAVLDDDDLWFPHTVERMVKELEANPEYGMVYSDAIVVNEAGKPISGNSRHAYPSGDIYEEVTLGRVICLMGAILFRRNSAFEVGLFDARLKSYEDRDFTIRVAEKFKLKFIDEPLLMYRKHESSMTAMQKYKVQYTEMLYQKIFQSRRFRDSSPRFQADLHSRYHIHLGKGYLGMAEYRLARRHFLKSLRYKPKRMAIYTLLAKAFIGKYMNASRR